MPRVGFSRRRSFPPREMFSRPPKPARRPSRVPVTMRPPISSCAVRNCGTGPAGPRPRSRCFGTALPATLGTLVFARRWPAFCSLPASAGKPSVNWLDCGACILRCSTAGGRWRATCSGRANRFRRGLPINARSRIFANGTGIVRCPSRSLHCSARWRGKKDLNCLRPLPACLAGERVRLLTALFPPHRQRRASRRWGGEGWGCLLNHSVASKLLQLPGKPLRQAQGPEQPEGPAGVAEACDFILCSP